MTNKSLITQAFWRGWEGASNLIRHGTDMNESDMEKFAAQKLLETLEKLDDKEEENENRTT